MTARANVQHPDEIALHDQWGPEQRADPLLPQDRVEDVGVIDVGDEDRGSLGGNAPGEPMPDRDADALLHLLLDPLRRPGDQLPGVRIEQEDRDGVHLEDLLDSNQELVEKLLEAELRQRGITQAVERPNLLARRQVWSDLWQ